MFSESLYDGMSLPNILEEYGESVEQYGEELKLICESDFGPMGPAWRSQPGFSNVGGK